MTETLMHIEIDEHMDVSLINCYNLQDISYIFENENICQAFQHRELSTKNCTISH